MAKNRLYDGPVNITGRSVTADRTAVYDKTLDHRRGGWSLTYEPRGNSGEGLDVNMLVYELLLLAGRDMIEVSKVVYGGDFTAAEMAGTVHSMLQLMENCNPGWEDYKHIRIKTKTFECSLDAGALFGQIAEWEGVCGITAAKAYRFHCDGKEMPKGTVLKKYVRWHGYKPTTVSLSAENTRIAKKFEVLGPMSEDLGSEGMKRALSVLTAIKSIKKLHGYDMGDLADRMLRRKLWRDYGKRERLHRREAWLTDEMKRTDQGSDRYKSMKKDLDEVRKKLSAPVSPVSYTARDFEHGPEVWKQVDEAYVTELIAYFRQVLADHPAPEWPKKGDVVQFKNREKMQKKYQGKFLCEGLVAFLSLYVDRIEWRASVRVKKYDCEYYLPGQLEPAEEGRSKKSGGRSKKSQPSAVSRQPSGKVAEVAGTGYTVKDGGKDVAFASYIPQQPSLADELFDVLLEIAA